MDQMLEQAAEDDEERNSDWTKVISALVRRWRDKDDTIEIPRVEELIKSIGHTEGSFALSTFNPEQRSEHCLFLDREPKENHAELPFEVDQTFVKKVEEKRAKIRARKPKSSIVQEFKNRNMDGKSRSQVISSTVVPSKKTEKREKKSRSHVLKSAKRPRSKALPFMSQKVKSVKIFEEMSVDKEDGETKKKKKRRGAGIATVGAMLKQKKKQKELEKKKERKMKEKKRKRDERQRKKEEAKRRKLEKKQSKGKRHVEKNETVETKPAPPTKKPAPPTKKPKTKPTSSDLKMTNFSGQGDNVLTEVDRKEILSFFRSKDSKNPYPNLGPMRKILLHKGYEFNEQGQKVKRIKIWMKLNYATREWFLAKTSKKSSSGSSSSSKS